MLDLSYATTLALHATALLAGRRGPEPAPVGDLAVALGVSENHLAKVMQRLARHGLVVSRRGPRGGFSLARPARRIRLLDVYEAMEGPLADRVCMLERPVCRGGECVMGELLGSIGRQVRDHLERTTLADLDWPHLELMSRSRDGHS